VAVFRLLEARQKLRNIQPAIFNAEMPGLWQKKYVITPQLNSKRRKINLEASKLNYGSILDKFDALYVHSDCYKNLRKNLLIF